MQKFSITLIFIFSLFLSASAQAIDLESITHIDAKIVVNRDASINVTETIEVIAAGQKFKNGIDRQYLTRISEGFGDYKTVGFKLLAVKHDGKPVPYVEEKFRDGVVVKVLASNL